MILFILIGLLPRLTGPIITAVGDTLNQIRLRVALRGHPERKCTDELTFDEESLHIHFGFVHP